MAIALGVGSSGAEVDEAVAADVAAAAKAGVTVGGTGAPIGRAAGVLAQEGSRSARASRQQTALGQTGLRYQKPIAGAAYFQ